MFFSNTRAIYIDGLISAALQLSIYKSSDTNNLHHINLMAGNLIDQQVFPSDKNNK